MVAGEPGRSRPALLLALFVVAFALSAWTSDDAYISFRTVSNALDGYGLTWNPIERVQSFTHPLWLFLHLAAVSITREVYFTNMALCFAFSIATFWIVVRRLGNNSAAGVIAGVALLASKAYFDYASSGLEDPLTRFLLVLYVLRLARPSESDGLQGTQLGCLAALGALCRPDAFLLFVPGIAHAAWLAKRNGATRRFLTGVTVGLVPLGLWAIFAFVYYGSPFPNTAFAKLAMGVPRHGLLLQSLAYVADSLSHDPLTLVVIGTSAIACWRQRDPVARVLVASALLYLAFVLWIGGDYMSGRLLGAPYLLAVTAALRLSWPALSKRRQGLLTAVLLVLLTVRAVSPALSDNVGPYGVGDERRTHHPYTGLFYSFTNSPWPQHSLRSDGEAAQLRQGVETSGAIGLFGYFAGPQTTIVDIFALSDPLLARLPGIIASPVPRAGLHNWRPGHTERPIPEGYLLTIAGEANHLEDPDLARYYDHIRLVTRGPLLSRKRLLTAARLQLGQYDHLRDSYVERHPQLFRRSLPDPVP